jgi:hypothetical protein
LFKAEAGRGAVVVRNLATSEQLEVPREQVVAWIVEHRGATAS